MWNVRDKNSGALVFFQASFASAANVAWTCKQDFIKNINIVLKKREMSFQFPTLLISAVNGLACHYYFRSLVDRVPTLCLRAHGFGDSDFSLALDTHIMNISSFSFRFRAKKNYYLCLFITGIDRNFHSKAFLFTMS